MNIKERILGVRSGYNFQEYQKFFLENPNQIKALIDVLINEKAYPMPEYASWILVHLCHTQKHEILKYQQQLIDFQFINNNDSACRNTLNIHKHLGITPYRESEFIDLLISYIQNSKNKVAVHVYSMQILIFFIQKHPELKKEIVEIIEINSEKKTPAYYSAQRNFVNKTAKY